MMLRNKVDTYSVLAHSLDEDEESEKSDDSEDSDQSEEITVDDENAI